MNLSKAALSWEAKAGELQIPGQLGVHFKILFQTTTETTATTKK
jgi:hypothetical protein